MHIAIIGAGATGLTAANALIAAGHRVSIVEMLDRPGGLAIGFKEPHWDWSVEKFYHHWFTSDADLLALASQIGVRDKVFFSSPKTVNVYRDKFYPIFGIKDALTFPGISLPGKLPWLASAAYLKLVSNWRDLEKLTAHDWCSRWMGREAYESQIYPILEGKFGAYAKQVNMAWMWARVKSRSFKLGTYQGGFQAFFDDLAAHVQKRGAEIRYGARVEQLVQTAGGWTIGGRRVDGAGPFSIAADAVLATTSPRIVTRLAPQLPDAYLGQLNALKSLGAVVLVFSMTRQLSEQGHYWHSLPKSAGFPYLAMCEHTNFVSPEHFGGDRIVYCGDYVATDHAYFSMSDDALIDHFAASLPRFNPAFERSWIKKAWVFKEAYAQPVPFVNHSQHLPALQTPLPGLFFASMSHVYPWDRGTNYAVQLGNTVAAQIAASAPPIP
jgi:protoporphyrinogen oxidase